jgi:outer membrane receptor protein involved in Fe transport
LQQLPQNVFGAREVGAALNGTGMSFNGAVNITGGASINLRGLGSESTLVLLDGRRMGKSGVFGGVTDVSGIPLRAVERVEIMLDGASAIYGSDAVGGVVNIILKKDFEGTEATYEYGAPQQGGFDEHIATVSGGFSWGNGRMRATVEHFQRTNLDGDDRPERVWRSAARYPGSYAASVFNQPLFYRFEGEHYLPSELASAGLTPASPGVQAINYATVAPGVSGMWGVDALQAYEVFAGVYDEDASEGVSLLPKQQRNSVQLGFDQRFSVFGAPVTLAGSAYYSQRDTYAARGSFAISMPIAADHPSNPFEAALITHWRIPGLADQHFQTEQEVARWSLRLDGVALGWNWTVAGGQSIDEIDMRHKGRPIATQNSPEFNALLDAGLNMFVADLLDSTPSDLLQSLVAAQQPRTMATNKEYTVEANASRALFALPGGEVHLAVGVDWRDEFLQTASASVLGATDLSGFNSSGPSGPFSEAQAGRVQRAAFTELLVPVVGAANARTGLRRLMFTGAVRYDDYNYYGSDTTWSLGAMFNPVDALSFRINRSTSFVAPTPRDGLIPRVDYDFSGIPGGLPWSLTDENGVPTGNSIGLAAAIDGGNPELTPETADSLSAGFEFSPPVIPGLSLRVTWHQTEYSNRIGASPVIQWIEGTDFAAKYPNISLHENGGLIWDLRAFNYAAVDVEGIDYQVRYNQDTGYGQILLSANVSYTAKYERLALPGEAPINEVASVDVLSQSVVPRYRYSANLGWYRGGLALNVDLSTASSTISRAPSAAAGGVISRIGKYAVATDLILSYDFDRAQGGLAPAWLGGTVLSLKVLNVLDDHPKYFIFNETTGENGPSEFNANLADPRGRMLQVGLTRRF